MLEPFVMVVEDDATLRSVLTRGLQEEGFRCESVGTGAAMLQRLGETNSPDALVLDIGLPDCDGRDACQALRARGVGTPVIFLTARDALVDR
ncbi:MAG: response regulator transcription factor, partial [Thermoleophilia bacterium]